MDFLSRFLRKSPAADMFASLTGSPSSSVENASGDQSPNKKADKSLSKSVIEHSSSLPNDKVSDDSSDSSLDYGSANEDSSPRDDIPSFASSNNNLNRNETEKFKQEMSQSLIETGDFKILQTKQKIYNVLTESFETPDSSILSASSESPNIVGNCEIGEDPLDVTITLANEIKNKDHTSKLFSNINTCRGSEENNLEGINLLNDTFDLALTQDSFSIDVDRSERNSQDRQEREASIEVLGEEETEQDRMLSESSYIRMPNNGQNIYANNDLTLNLKQNGLNNFFENELKTIDMKRVEESTHQDSDNFGNQRRDSGASIFVISTDNFSDDRNVISEKLVTEQDKAVNNLNNYQIVDKMSQSDDSAKMIENCANSIMHLESTEKLINIDFKNNNNASIENHKHVVNTSVEISENNNLSTLDYDAVSIDQNENTTMSGNEHLKENVSMNNNIEISEPTNITISPKAESVNMPTDQNKSNNSIAENGMLLNVENSNQEFAKNISKESFPGNNSQDDEKLLQQIDAELAKPVFEENIVISNPVSDDTSIRTGDQHNVINNDFCEPMDCDDSYVVPSVPHHTMALNENQTVGSIENDPNIMSLNGNKIDLSKFEENMVDSIEAECKMSIDCRMSVDSLNFDMENPFASKIKIRNSLDREIVKSFTESVDNSENTQNTVNVNNAEPIIPNDHDVQVPKEESEKNKVIQESCPTVGVVNDSMSHQTIPVIDNKTVEIEVKLEDSAVVGVENDSIQQITQPISVTNSSNEKEIIVPEVKLEESSVVSMENQSIEEISQTNSVIASSNDNIMEPEVELKNSSAICVEIDSTPNITQPISVNTSSNDNKILEPDVKLEECAVSVESDSAQNISQPISANASTNDNKILEPEVKLEECGVVIVENDSTSPINQTVTDAPLVNENRTEEAEVISEKSAFVSVEKLSTEPIAQSINDTVVIEPEMKSAETHTHQDSECIGNMQEKTGNCPDNDPAAAMLSQNAIIENGACSAPIADDVTALDDVIEESPMVSSSDEDSLERTLRAEGTPSISAIRDHIRRISRNPALSPMSRCGDLMGMSPVAQAKVAGEAPISEDDISDLLTGGCVEEPDEVEPEDCFKVPDDLFKDSAAFDYLLSCGNNSEAARSAVPIRDFAKESLFVKFDPLVRLPQGTRPGREAPVPSDIKVDEDISGLVESCSSDSSAGPIISETVTTSGTMSSVEQNSTHHVNQPPIASVVGLQLGDKPTQVVTPAKSTRHQLYQQPCTPNAPIKNSSTAPVSPAIAVIDRLINLGLNTPPPPPPVVQPKEPEMDPQLLNELQSVRELLSTQEQELKQANETNSTLKQQLAESNEREQALIERVNEKNKNHRQMSVVMEEYERTMSELISEREVEKRQWLEERANLIRERDEVSSHLANIELSFNDTHVKYERCKTVIQTYKNNEDFLKQTVGKQEENLKKQMERYEQLRQHAMSQLEKSNFEIDSVKKSSQAEIIKYQAMLKKSEIEISSLRESLAQKTKNCEELTSICDDLINKVG